MLTAVTTFRSDVRTLLKRAWSLRFIGIAIVLSGLEVGLGIFANNPPIPRGAFALLSALASGAAFWARLVAQKGITPEKIGEES